MRPTNHSRTRRWIGASALALMLGLGGVSTAFVASSQNVVAQAQAPVQDTGQIAVPNIANVPSFADLVDAVKPAVVSIQVESSEGPVDPRFGGGEDFDFQFPDLPEDHPLRPFFDQFGNNGPQAPQQQRRMLATGSGFIVSADGFIVTNNHVVENASRVTVVFDNGDEMEATIVGTDPRTDLAVIKVEGTELPFVTFEEEETRVGDWVVAVGNPFGLGGTVTVGIVSARGRDIGGSNYGDFLQIDAAVNTGNSGGPAFNLRGQVVGVNTAIYSPNGGNVGIAFAIPASTVSQVVNQLIESGTVTRGFLGVSIQDVSRDIADSVGLAEARGALVTTPTENSPAAQAGIQSGDIITAVDGTPIANALALSRTIASKAPGTVVELRVFRDGAEQTISVTLGTLEEETAQAEEGASPPDQQEIQPAQSSVGMTLVPNAEGEGLLVQDVDPNSIAAEKGFAVGDAILEVNNTPVRTVEEFERALDAVRQGGRQTALVKATRDGNVRFIGLPLAEQ